jgi:hypothetical protein
VTLEERKAAALAKARARLQSAPADAQTEGANSGLLDALSNGWDAAGESVGLGIEGIGDYIGSETLSKMGAKQAALNRAQQKLANYQRPAEADGVLRNLMEGEFANAGSSLLYSTAENAAPLAGGALASIGAATVGTAAALPTAVVGGTVAAVSSAMGAVQTLGDIRQEKKQKNLPDDLNLGDFATAVASGAAELVPIGKGGGFMLKIGKEAAQEGIQEGLQIGDVALQGGEYVPQEVAERLFDAAATGGLMAGTVNTSITAADKSIGAVVDGYGAASDAVSSVVSKTDNRDFTDDEIRAAKLLRRAADNSDETLGNVDSDVGQGTAKGAANAALRRLRSEISTAASGLRALAKTTGNTEATTAINTLTRIGQHQMSSLPDSFTSDLKESFQTLRETFGDVQEVNKLGSLVNQTDSIASFTSKSDRDMGGLSRFTKRIDPTDDRNDSITKGMALGGMGISMSATGLAGPLAAIAVNRIARRIDKMTNRRSMVKRFTDSALKSGREVQEIGGKPALQVLEELKAQRAAEAASQKLQIAQAQQAAKGVPPNVAQGQPQGSAQAATQAMSAKEAKAQAKAERDAALYKTNAYALGDMFETGHIPEGDTYFNTYRYMKEQTGLDPADALQTIEKLEAEGIVGKGTAQRFAEEPRSFADDVEMTVAVQRAVKQRANPSFVPKPAPTPEQVLKKMSAVGTGIGGTQAQFKAREGKRRKNNLVADIEGSDASLSSDEMQHLYDLAEAIDSSEMIRADRFKTINEMLPVIFKDNVAKVEVWKKKFAGLAGIGNDVAYTRKTDEQVKDEAKDENLAKIKEAKPKRTKGAVPSADNINARPEERQSPPQTKEDRALEKLKNPEPKAPEDAPSEAAKVKDAEEPTSVGPVQDTKEPNRKGLKGRVEARVGFIKSSLDLASKWGDALQSYMDQLPSSVEGRVEGLIYKAASDRLTVNMLAEQFASKFDVPVEAAVVMVNDVLTKWENDGLVKRISLFNNSKLISDGKYAKDAAGNTLDALNLEILDPQMKERVEVAKAVSMAERMIPQDAPESDFTPENLSEGPYTAIKDVDPSRVDQSWQPILDTLNTMRRQKLSVNNSMLTQIEDALGGVGEKKQGTINDVLTPKDAKTNRRDDGPMRTVAQLLYQLGDKNSRTSNLIRQEWGAGANLRIYSKNGLAHTQAGDIMKGLLRLPEKSKLGGTRGLGYVFHGLGNLLGYDKRSPAERRNAIFTEGIVDDLVKFASDPFGRTVMKDRNNKPTKISQVVGKGEGFFQVLNAAHEVKAMVDFARARHKDKDKLSNAELLQNPEVQGDLSENYETDFIVQLDASNNAYQIAGMAMGYEDVLRATGLLPREGMDGDPDGIQGADIYLQPALSIASRVPELNSLLQSEALSNEKLRKIFKGPIGTYLYAAEFNSRQDAFRDVLNDIASPKPVFGLVEGEGLITIPTHISSAILSPEGHIFNVPKYDVNGETKDTKRVRKRVVAVEGKKGTQYKVQSADGNGAFKGNKKFQTESEAVAYAYEMDMYVRMNDELIRDMNTRYPDMREYLNFAATVSDMVKAEGKTSVKVPTKDGMMLEYSFKQNPTFTSVPVTKADGNVVNLGVRTPDTKLAGRGLAAFMTHQNDAWALRETHKRMIGSPEFKGFNPIHDSFGFHPSDAAKGQETWVQVMQELGADDYNIFLNILEANGISPEAYSSVGGNLQFIMGRKGVAPVAPNRIPTALS